MTQNLPILWRNTDDKAFVFLMKKSNCGPKLEAKIYNVAKVNSRDGHASRKLEKFEPQPSSFELKARTRP